jgi:hypothetical protein
MREFLEPTTKRIVIQPDDLPSYYANTFRFRFGDNDCSLIFGLEAPDPAGKQCIFDKCDVILTPRVLKILSLTLSHILTEVEKAIGTIPVPNETEIRNQKIEIATPPPPKSD